jgi:hypothetical protein
MMKRVLFAAALAFVILQFEPAPAAGPYDGNWSGPISAGAKSCLAGKVTMQISNNAISGVIGLAAGSIRIQGNVAADGSVKATYNNPSTGGESTLTGKISGDDFTGELESKFPMAGIGCTRDVTAKRS